MTRKVIPHGGRYYHVLNLTDPAQVDDTVADLLAEAYDLAPE